VSVADNGTPSLQGTNTATVTINVNRNSQAPQFLGTPYRSDITRIVQDNSVLPGVSVITSDGDTVVSRVIVGSALIFRNGTNAVWQFSNNFRQKWSS
jgi:uncharacterized cupin superfamily protein